MMDAAARSFDAVARLYDAVRPGYPAEVYDFIQARKSFGGGSRILEVGAGQGAATREILDRWDAELVALEPGERFCAMLREKFGESSKVRIVNTTFEEFAEEGPYDGLFSATAFHWIDPAVKYAKAHRLLKDDGLLALYWNNFSVADPVLRAEMEESYRRYFPPSESAGSDVVAAQLSGIEKRRMELATSGWFTLAGHTVIEHTVRFSAERYVELLKTFSDHSSVDPAVTKKLYDEVALIIASAGGTIDVRIRVNIELGRKIP